MGQRERMGRERTRSLSDSSLDHKVPTDNGLKAFEKSFSVFTSVKCFLGGPWAFSSSSQAS